MPKSKKALPLFLPEDEGDHIVCIQVTMGNTGTMTRSLCRITHQPTGRQIWVVCTAVQYHGSDLPEFKADILGYASKGPCLSNTPGCDCMDEAVGEKPIRDHFLKHPLSILMQALGLVKAEVIEVSGNIGVARQAVAKACELDEVDIQESKMTYRQFMAQNTDPGKN